MGVAQGAFDLWDQNNLASIEQYFASAEKSIHRNLLDFHRVESKLHDMKQYVLT